MQELIKVEKRNGQRVVSGRELHGFLESKPPAMLTEHLRNGRQYVSANEVLASGGKLSPFMGLMSDVVPVTGALRRVSETPIFLAGEDISEVYDVVDYLIPWDMLEVHLRAGERANAAAEEPEEACTYILLSPATGLVKIGKSTNVAKRIKALSTASGEALELLCLIEQDIETELHRRFKAHRRAGEWFVYAPEINQFVAQNKPK